LALARADRASDREAVTVDVGATLSERAATWEPIAADHGVTVVAEPCAVQVRSADDHLSQAIDNLLANAIDASPAGSTVRLWAARSARADRASESSSATTTEQIEIHVTDQGPGMTAEQRAKAFDRFWRAGAAPSDLGGTGLGLAIARKMVRADRGDIELREAEGGGLDAIIRLPAG
jgi:signal transduction histidine kinase